MENKKEKEEKVLVLGAGSSGIAATKLLIMKNIKVILYDDNKNINIDDIKSKIPNDEMYELIINNFDEKLLSKITLCVISPGFPKYNNLIMEIRVRNIPIISEIELGSRFLKGNVCAITGSNGKTTTIKLIGEILKKHYNDVRVLGNVGEPVCSEAIYTNEKSVTALEVSSFQLEDINKFRPNVAAILNLSPDHLDRYNSYQEYIEAKLNIAANQTSTDYLVLNFEDTILRELSLNKNLFKSRIIFFSSKRTLVEGFYVKNDCIFYKNNSKNIKLLNVSELKLLGMHNYENVMAAMAVTYYMNVPFTQIVEACKEFAPIEHRLEFVRERCGIKFYNDSKGTNPDAAIKAIDALKGKIILIAGGYDKRVDYGDLVSKIKEKVKYLVLIGAAKRAIANRCRDFNYTNVVFADTLEEAVEIANSYANAGENVLLSPACSSYDMFKSYKERGLVFKNKVMSLK